MLALDINNLKIEDKNWRLKWSAGNICLNLKYLSHLPSYLPRVYLQICPILIFVQHCEILFRNNQWLHWRVFFLGPTKIFILPFPPTSDFCFHSGNSWSVVQLCQSSILTMSFTSEHTMRIDRQYLRLKSVTNVYDKKISKYFPSLFHPFLFPPTKSYKRLNSSFKWQFSPWILPFNFFGWKVKYRKNWAFQYEVTCMK